MQLLEPVEELLDHWLANKRLAVLRHQHLRIQPADPGCPDATGTIARHVAPVKALHLALVCISQRGRDEITSGS